MSDFTAPMAPSSLAGNEAKSGFMAATRAGTPEARLAAFSTSEGRGSNALVAARIPGPTVLRVLAIPVRSPLSAVNAVVSSPAAAPGSISWERFPNSVTRDST